MAVIALDLGGTKLAGAIFAERGKPVGKRIAPLDGRQGQAVGELIRQQLTDLLAIARARRIQIGAIGVSVPGISHAQTGTVWAPNIPGWEDYPLRRELEAEVRQHLSPALSVCSPGFSLSGSLISDRLKPGLQAEAALPGGARLAAPIPVLVECDRACYILGETWHGAAKGCQNAIFLAVGTGIGAGILVEGRILRGAHDSAGAIGWLALDRPFRPEYVACGCFEHHASGAGLAKVATALQARRPRPTNLSTLRRSSAPTAHDLFSAYEHGDPIAKEVLGQATEFWGMAVANLVSLFNPEKIIFGGGVFGPATQFLDDIHAEARKWAQPVAIEQVKLLPSKLGADAGLYGAARLALQAAQANEKRRKMRSRKMKTGKLKTRK